jgi:hypothetical protein
VKLFNNLALFGARSLSLAMRSSSAPSESRPASISGWSGGSCARATRHPMCEAQSWLLDWYQYVGSVWRARALSRAVRSSSACSEADPGSVSGRLVGSSSHRAQCDIQASAAFCYGKLQNMWRSWAGSHVQGGGAECVHPRRQEQHFSSAPYTCRSLHTLIR